MAEVGTTLRAALELDATKFQKELKKSADKLEDFADAGLDVGKIQSELDGLFASFNKFNTGLLDKVTKTFDGFEKTTSKKLEKITNNSNKQIERLTSELHKAQEPQTDADTFKTQALGVEKMAKAYKTLSDLKHREHEETIAELKLEIDEELKNYRKKQQEELDLLAIKDKQSLIDYRNSQAGLMDAERLLAAEEKQFKIAKKHSLEKLDNIRQERLALQKKRDEQAQANKKIDRAIKAREKAEKKAEKAIREQIKKTEEARKKFWNNMKAPIKAFGASVVVLNQFKELMGSIFRAAKTFWDYTYGQVIKVNAEMENFMMRLKVVSGSESSAKAIFQDTVDFAKTVTFTLRESMQNATNLLPVLAGGKEELKKWLPVIADISATFGLSFQEATSNFVKAYSAGIAAADLFRERGITPALGFQPKTYYSPEDTRKIIYEQWMSAGSLFRGASKELASTWDGIVGMLEDRWNIFMQKVGNAGIFKDLKNNLQDILNAFDYLYNAVDDKGVSLLDRMAQNFSNMLSNFLQIIRDVVINIFTFLSKQDFFEAMFKSSDQQKLEKKIEKLSQKTRNLKISADPISGVGDPRKLKEAEEELENLKQQLSDLKKNDPFTSMSQSIDVMLKNLEQAKKISKASQLTSGEKSSRQASKEYNRSLETERMRLRKIAGITKDANQKILTASGKASIEALKETEGAWTATQKSISLKTEKFTKKMKDMWIKQGFNFATEQKDINNMTMTAELERESNSYKAALTEQAILKERGAYKKKILEAELELKNIGMTDYQQKYNDILSDYSQKLKDAAPACKNLAYEEFALNKQRLQMLDEQKRTQAQLVSQAAVNQSQYGRYSPYSAQIQALEDSLNQDLAGGMSVPDAYGKQDSGFTQLQAQWLQQANDQILTYNEKLEEVGKTTEEIAKIQFNRQIQSWQDMKANATDPALIAALDNIIAKANELHNIEYPKTFGEGWKKGLEDFESQIKSTGENARAMSSQIASDMSDAMADGFFDVLKGDFDNLGEVINNFAENVIKALIKIQTQKMAVATMEGITSMVGSFFHNGGIIGQDSPTFTKQVNPAIFNGAPRFHNGLMPDEFPAILQKGEAVIPKKQVQSSIKQTQYSNVEVRIHNESQNKLEVKRADSQQDVSGMILDVWIDGYARNKNGLRTMLGG